MLEHFKTKLSESYELNVLDNLYQYQLDDIVSKIDELISTETILMGWSLGGMLAQHYASLNPDNHKLKAVILLNSSACFLERDDYIQGVKQADFESLQQIVTGKNTKALLRLFGHLLVEGSCCHKEDRRFLKQVFNERTLPGWGILAKGLNYLEHLDFRLVLSSIHQPTLFILGEQDVLINASSAHSLEHKKHIKTHVISAMGHFPFGSFAEVVANIVKDYVFSLNKNVSSS